MRFSRRDTRDFRSRKSDRTSGRGGVAENPRENIYFEWFFQQFPDDLF
jgi:hypothetical protein